MRESPSVFGVFASWFGGELILESLIPGGLEALERSLRSSVLSLSESSLGDSEKDRSGIGEIKSETGGENIGLSIKYVK